jgi:hypothetical protein
VPIFDALLRPSREAGRWFAWHPDLPPEIDRDFGDQLVGGESRSGDYTGIKALMVAVLDEAASCFLGPSGRLRREAEEWVMSRRRRSPFAFTVVCETLGLEPDAVRKRLAEARLQGDTVRKALGRPRKNASRRRALTS